MIEVLAWPLRTADNQYVTVEQGSPADIIGRVQILLTTPYGHLDGLPDFGVDEQAHLAGGPDVSEINRQLDEHIPQGDLAAAAIEDPDGLNAALAVIDVRIGG